MFTQIGPWRHNRIHKPVAKALLLEGQKQAQAQGIEADTLLLEGNVVDDIVKTAKEGHFDLIVIGARGLSKFEAIMLGSVSGGVLRSHHAP